MSLRGMLHERWRTRTSLLAAGVLEAAERERTLAHLKTCADCRREHEEAVELLRLMAADPVRDADVPVPVQFLVARVNARVDSALASRPMRWATLAYATALAALLVVVVPPLVTRLAARFDGAGSRATPPPAALPETATMDDASFHRAERAMSREQAVRYLAEAQDVLMTVAANPAPCPEKSEHVDVRQQVERSRALLERRALLVSLDDDNVASARPVLEDVEQTLRQVAALESCAKGGDLERVRREMERRRLLMKMRLMSRELQS